MGDSRYCATPRAAHVLRRESLHPPVQADILDLDLDLDAMLGELSFPRLGGQVGCGVGPTSPVGAIVGCVAITRRLGGPHRASEGPVSAAVVGHAASSSGSACWAAS